METKKILIVGGAGFIGSMLTKQLLEQGYSVMIVDLTPPKIQHPQLTYCNTNLMTETVVPEITQEVWYGVINLTGATIGKRWNAAYKKTLYDSRILTTKNLVAILATLPQKPTVLVQASAIGYYGDQKDTILTENHAPGTDFLATLCVDWEHEAREAEKYGIRVVLIRTAHVLGKGGLLASLLPLFKKGLGGYFGTGAQYMPWIHWKDVVGVYVYALEHTLTGAYNVGVGQAPTQKTLFKTFGK
jgi:uncharacterized protein (TIGR01777 family)